MWLNNSLEILIGENDRFITPTHLKSKWVCYGCYGLYDSLVWVMTVLPSPDDKVSVIAYVLYFITMLFYNFSTLYVLCSCSIWQLSNPYEIPDQSIWIFCRKRAWELSDMWELPRWRDFLFNQGGPYFKKFSLGDNRFGPMSQTNVSNYLPPPPLPDNRKPNYENID